MEKEKKSTLNKFRKKKKVAVDSKPKVPTVVDPKARKPFLSGGEVVVHPIVLLGVLDHYMRVAKGTTKRVVGALLGEEQSDGNLHVTNYFAVPFEEDPRDPLVWFVDRSYAEEMALMMHKVNRKERIVGWYSTGPRIKPVDLEINEMFRKYCPEPVLMILDVLPTDTGDKSPAQLLPQVECYYSVEEETSDKMFRRTFIHLPSKMGAFEAEEIGVEHLLRDIKNASTSTLASRITDKVSALNTLVRKLGDLSSYLADCVSGKLPPNHSIIAMLQDVFNSLPDFNDPEAARALRVQTNDMMLCTYLGAMLQSTVALHDLINNKIKNKTGSENGVVRDEKKTAA